MRTWETSGPFLDAFGKLLGREQGYSDHPNDRGGETKYGISKRAHSHLDIPNLTLDQAADIYFKDYWMAARCPSINSTAIRLELFDSAVLHGVQRAIRFLQAACNRLRVTPNEELEVDGKLGPATMTAINRWRYPMSLVMVQNLEQAAFIHHLIDEDPTQAVNYRGWLKRIQL